MGKSAEEKAEEKDWESFSLWILPRPAYWVQDSLQLQAVSLVGPALIAKWAVVSGGALV